MDQLLHALRAAGEPTRLRLLALLAGTELTVTEITQIVAQSQPRVSRHLKLLVDAGLLDRFQEGSWAFYRLSQQKDRARIARTILELLPADDAVISRDREHLDSVRQARARTAARYFSEQAERWDQVRALYVPETEVEQAMRDALGEGRVETLLDLGTGTGRVLEIFADRAAQGVGIDQSREMLTVARSNLDRAGLAHCQVRQGDLYNLALPAGSADVVTLHHVLHFLTDPATAIAEAARVLRPRGVLLVVDFAPHHLEVLRAEHAHRRLGFADAEIARWCAKAGLESFAARHLQAARPAAAGESLTVTLWTTRQRADAPSHHRLEVA